jgi:hypothetical protein
MYFTIERSLVATTRPCSHSVLSAPRTLSTLHHCMHGDVTGKARLHNYGRHAHEHVWGMRQVYTCVGCIEEQEGLRPKTNGQMPWWTLLT